MSTTDPTTLRRPPPEFRRATVTNAEQRSPRLIRVRLEGPELVGLDPPEPAASVRLLLPRGGHGSVLDLPTWNGNEFLYDDGTRPPIRTLTPLHTDPGAGSLDLDVVLHGQGALSDWARARPVGDEVAISGPGRGSSPDPTAPRFVLVGDESAMPAIGQILEHLPASAEVDVVIEISHVDARVELPRQAGTTATWVELAPGEAPGSAMISAFAAIELGDDVQIWASGEAAAMQQLRALVHNERGVSRKQTMIRGYWKHGRVGAGTT